MKSLVGLGIGRLKPPAAPVIEAPPLVSGFCDVSNLLIIDCSRTQTGTHKDFRSRGLLEQFGGMDPVFYSITMGNAGYSLGRMAKSYNMETGRNVRVINVVDLAIDARIMRMLEAVSDVVRTDLRGHMLTQAELLAIVRAVVETKERILVHAESGNFTNRQLVFPALNAGAGPIFLPIGSGELMESFLEGAAISKAAGIRVPKIVGVTINSNIFSGRAASECLDAASVADKLVSPTSMFFSSINKLLGGLGADIITVSDNEIMEAFSILKSAGVRAEPSAAAAFAGLRKADIGSRAEATVLNSGCGLYYED